MTHRDIDIPVARAHDFARECGAHLAACILFGGDRATCCEEALGLYERDTLVAVATLSRQGEQNSGVPSVVGVYTHPDHRGKGYAKA